MQITLTLFCVLWWLLGVVMLVNLWMVKSLAKLPLREREEWPSLTIVAPACNEAESLEVAIKRRLQSTYPNLRILLINDRSTDNTGEIAEQLASQDDRLEVLHNKELPEGWLGKVNVLRLRAEQAESDWILFSDADVVIEPGALRRAVSYCETQKTFSEGAVERNE